MRFLLAHVLIPIGIVTGCVAAFSALVGIIFGWSMLWQWVLPDRIEYPGTAMMLVSIFVFILVFIGRDMMGYGQNHKHTNTHTEYAWDNDEWIQLGDDLWAKQID